MSADILYGDRLGQMVADVVRRATVHQPIRVRAYRLETPDRGVEYRVSVVLVTSEDTYSTYATVGKVMGDGDPDDHTHLSQEARTLARTLVSRIKSGTKYVHYEEYGLGEEDRVRQ